ncbi:hypothetical protein G6L94_33820 [Agrobacterium rhizogenes]|nr:hypothetical protein [Rhizobium rhizogenes]NTI98659.1 hypothetical protein [Rhizobium rhizogenes]NTJ61127.1 hypothetical protein [Rhizobium rhizogenes]
MIVKQAADANMVLITPEAGEEILDGKLRQQPVDYRIALPTFGQMNVDKSRKPTKREFASKAMVNALGTVAALSGSSGAAAPA